MLRSHSWCRNSMRSTWLRLTIRAELFGVPVRHSLGFALCIFAIEAGSVVRGAKRWSVGGGIVQDSVRVVR